MFVCVHKYAKFARPVSIFGSNKMCIGAELPKVYIIILCGYQKKEKPKKRGGGMKVFGQSVLKSK